MQTNVRTHSANRVAIVMDGVEVGLAQSVRPSDNYAHDKASGIGDIHVQEHVPTMANHSITVTNMLLKNKNLRQQGLIPENGDSVLRGPVFDILVQDKDTGRVVRKYIGCTYDSGDLDIQKHAIISSSANFLALDVSGTDL